jgi:hypothetical protein
MCAIRYFVFVLDIICMNLFRYESMFSRFFYLVLFVLNFSVVKGTKTIQVKKLKHTDLEESVNIFHYKLPKSLCSFNWV